MNVLTQVVHRTRHHLTAIVCFCVVAFYALHEVTFNAHENTGQHSSGNVPGATRDPAAGVDSLSTTLDAGNVATYTPAAKPEKRASSDASGDAVQSKEVASTDLPPMADGMIAVTPGGGGFRITNTKRTSPVVNVPFDPALLPAGITLNDIEVYIYNDTTKTWGQTKKEGVDPEKNLIYSRLHTDGTVISGIIILPELPQADSFAPTFMKDLKAGDPSSLVQLIEAPVPNARGSASLSYEIEIPPGRKGLQPELTVKYDSDATNGLLGDGWDLNTPSVTVETRWGVPLYDPNIETETYLVNGEMVAFEISDQLSTTAHRTKNIPRDRDRKFHPRRQQNFNTIVRHGDKPWNYWWEVIDRNGTRFFYGEDRQKDAGVLTEIVVEQARLRTPRANHPIAEWKLCRIEDVYGNFVRFNYMQEQAAVGAENVTQCVLSSIEYTGWEVNGIQGQSPNYRVEFITVDNPNFQFNARQGYLAGNVRKLSEIIIKLNAFYDGHPLPTNKLVRRYKFDYLPAAPFNKVLLEKIQQFGTEDHLFNEHIFSYHDDTKQGLFASETNWPSSSDNLDTNLAIKLIADDPTDLGGSVSKGVGSSFYAGFGYNDQRYQNRSVTAGAQFSSNRTVSDGLNTLIDINGDGLPDKVFVSGGMLHFKKNTGSGFSNHVTPIEGTVAQFQHDESYTSTTGVSAYFSVASGAKDKSFTSSDNSVYFSDVNGDGLPDIVQDGVVHFNRLVINGADTIPTFNPSSSGTPSPITGGKISVADPVDYASQRELLAEENPLHDVVRMWQAPFPGTVSILAPVRLLKPIVDPNDYFAGKELDKADGVIVSIQHKDSLWWKELSRDDNDQHQLLSATINVKHNDRIFFRVESGKNNLSNGGFDLVEWEPKIQYEAVGNVPVTGNVAARNDVFGKPKYRFDVEEDFLVSRTGGGIQVDTLKDVMIHLPFRKGITSDSVKVEILKFSESKTDQARRQNQSPAEEGGKPVFKYTVFSVLFAQEFGPDEVSTKLNASGTLPARLEKDSLYVFRISSKVNTWYKEISWEPFITVANANNVNSNPDTVFVVPEYKMNLWQRRQGELFHVADSQAYFIRPHRTFVNKKRANDSVWFVIRKDKEILARHHIRFANGNVQSFIRDTITFLPNSEYFVSYEADSIETLNIKTNEFILEDFTRFKPSFEHEQGEAFIAPFDNTYIVKHSITFRNAANENIEFTVFKNNARVNHGFLHYNGTHILHQGDTLPLKRGDRIEINYKRNNPVDPLDEGEFVFPFTLVSRVITADLWTERMNMSFGPMYRQWGQFVYRNRKNGGITSINENLLKQTFSEGDKDGIHANVRDQVRNDNLNPASLSGLDKLNNKTAPFSSMVPYRHRKFYMWKGMDEDISMSDSIQQSARVGLNDVMIQSPFDFTAPAGTGASGIIKRTSSTGTSHNVGAYGLVGSKVTGTSSIEADFLDMNGDHFPDVISKSQIQVTDATGTLGGGSAPVALGGFHHEGDNIGAGVQMGGSRSMPVNTSNAAAGRIDQSPVAENSQNSASASGATTSASANIGVSGAFSGGTENIHKTFLDINGDGLPDQITRGGLVRLNLGYSFSNAVAFDQIKSVGLNENTTFSPSFSFGFNNGNNSISAGAGVSLSTSVPRETLHDINGDGLIDKIFIQNHTARFNINNGNGKFSEASSTLALTSGKEAFQGSFGMSLGGNVTIGFPVPMPAPPFAPIFKIVFSPGLNKSNGLGVTHQLFNDINGDGYVDHLFSEKSGELKVQLSSIGRTNKLKTIRRPLGGTIEISYKRSKATTEHPGGKWVMSVVKTDDGIAEDRKSPDANYDTRSSFTYNGGKHDRYEREFLGFREVITEEHDFDSTKILRRQIQEFDNNSYYTSGLVVATRIENAAKAKYVETVSKYHYVPNAVGNEATQQQGEETISVRYDGVYFSHLKYISNIAYEGGRAKLILNETYFEYDALGNNVLLRYSKRGDMEDFKYQDGDYELRKRYIARNAAGIFGLAEGYTLGSNGGILREGKANYDGLGRIIEHSVRLNSNEWATTLFKKCDQYGNPLEKIDPDNFKTVYGYDPRLHTHLSSITEGTEALGHGETSEVTYDVKFAVPKFKKDANINEVNYTFDEFGRITDVWWAEESTAGTPTLKIIYDPVDAIRRPRYHTSEVHNVQGCSSCNIVTHNYSDGEKRVVQSKKRAILHRANVLRVEKWITSGRIKYDALSRAVEKYDPSAALTEAYETQPTPSVAAPATMTYDVLDRMTSSTMPDGRTYLTNDFSIRESFLIKRTTIHHNRDTTRDLITTEYTNGAGEKVRTDLRYGNGRITTQFAHNALHQLTSVRDSRGNETTFTYDLAGRRIKKQSPDGGTTFFVYDKLGNMMEELSSDNQSITHRYDHRRLIETTYSKFPENNVKYYYGSGSLASRVAHNVNRVYYKETAAGDELYSYDLRGNVISVKKRIIAPFDKIYTFETKYSYDVFNRLREIEYPDREVVSYLYNDAGALIKIEKPGTEYVANIGYDEFEQRTFIKYGNDVESIYTYDDRRRLNNLASTYRNGNSSSKYDFDDLNNVTRLTNVSNPGNGIPASELIHNFRYSNAGQLEFAEGLINGQQNYAQELRYDNRFNIVSNDLVLESASLHTTRKLGYKVDEKSNRLRSLTERQERVKRGSNLDQHYKQEFLHNFLFDEKGNNDVVSKDASKRPNITRRQILFDDENRISAVNLDGFVSNHFYDDDRRVVKLSTQTTNIYTNGTLAAGRHLSTGSFSLYVNPYFSTRNGGSLYTKHIYIGSQRIASEVSSMNLVQTPFSCNHNISPACKEADLPGKKIQIEKLINLVYDTFDLERDSITADNFRNVALSYDGIDNPQLELQQNIPTDVNDGKLYFYHTNQVHSVNYVTDEEGNVVQHLEYLPYGQTFYEYRQGYSSQFTFSGRESDRETGLSYFGARYYDAQLGSWLSVDPMEENYPGRSPYNFALNNPVKYYDPDGNYVESAIDLYSLITGIQETRQHMKDGNYGMAFLSSVGVGLDMAALATPLPGGVSMAIKFGSKAPDAVKVVDAANDIKGGANLFRKSAPQTAKETGWKTGDFMLYLPNKGTPKLNWKQNSGALRREMGENKPIFDSFREADGSLIEAPKGTFLNAERSLLKERGWTYEKLKGAWMPPAPK